MKGFKMLNFLVPILIIITQCAWSSGWQEDQKVNNLQLGGHLSTYQTTVPIASSCGTNPSVATRSADLTGTLTIGAGSVTFCRVAFANSYVNAPNCFLVQRTLNPFVTSEIATTDTAAIYIQSPVQNMAGTTTSWFCSENQ